VAGVIRRASGDDLVRLFDLEKAASTAGLAHIFGPDLPFPDDDVLARWRLVLDEPGMTVLIDEALARPVGYAAFAGGWLRHFWVHPDWWGTGRASVLHARALAEMAAAGATTTYLWVLVDNRRARAFYRREGWEETAVRETEVFAPYPEKLQMTRSR
jgi:GNAT superfamily N-acetyltransferase